ncbi:MAG: hypothetical protein LQ337_002607 [Flavoplaca oasis]|nr:MAG: hypothetical protein LQ337_002607 [Flavoplaca oasis]
MPIYDIKQSSKIPGQIRAYDWLSRAASKALHKELLYRLAQWGVSEFHDGTYILVPEKWKNLDPMDILAMSDLENCPRRNAVQWLGGCDKKKEQRKFQNTVKNITHHAVYSTLPLQRMGRTAFNLTFYVKHAAYQSESFRYKDHEDISTRRWKQSSPADSRP